MSTTFNIRREAIGYSFGFHDMERSSIISLTRSELAALHETISMFLSDTAILSISMHIGRKPDADG